MSNNKTSSGIGFSSLLLLAFIILKLCGVIDWSWWWVLCPLWIIPAILLVGFVIYLLIKVLVKPRKHEPPPPPKSKWQERLEQMQEAQRLRK